MWGHVHQSALAYLVDPSVVLPSVLPGLPVVESDAASCATQQLHLIQANESRAVRQRVVDHFVLSWPAVEQAEWKDTTMPEL